MGNRSILEINHDLTPYTDEEKLKWTRSMIDYLSSGNPKYLPEGVTWFGMRHHLKPCSMGEPPKGWDNKS